MSREWSRHTAKYEDDYTEDSDYLDFQGWECIGIRDGERIWKIRDIGMRRNKAGKLVPCYMIKTESEAVEIERERHR